MKCTNHWMGVVLVLGTLSVASGAHAQTGLARAILALDNAPAGPVRVIDSRLFGASVQARIIDRNSNGADFAEEDEIEFTISRGADVLPFVESIRTRAAFEDWARRNSDGLLAIIFPGSLSSAALGRDTGQLYAQQLLLFTALGDEVREPGAPQRSTAGGLLEFEWTQSDDSRPADSTWAWQWLYAFGRFAAVQGRYAQTHQGLDTGAWGITVDYHPYMEMEKNDVILRVGATARTGFLYSHSELTGARDAIDLGTVDVGGGGWASVRKNFRRFRLGGGMLYQGTKSFVPVIDESELDFLAGIIRRRGIAWDVAYGGTAAVNTSHTTAVIAKYLESRSIKSEFDRPALHLFLIGYSFTLAPGSALNAGYKITSSGGLRSGSVFLQGNFGW